MTDISRSKRILFLAMPITLGMLSQNIMSLIDTFMVGKLGSSALAAVGLGSFLVFLCHAITLGMSTGVQTASSHLLGQNRDNEIAQPLNAALLVMLVFAPLYSALLFYFMPFLLDTLNPDPQVVEQAVPYTQARILAVLFVGINFAFRGYLAATHMLRIYLLVTLAMHVINVILNYLLIYGNAGFPALGVEGAGIASAVAAAAASFVYMLCLFYFSRQQGFLRRAEMQPWVQKVLASGLPYGLQQTAFAAGFVSFFWLIGLMGTHELAAASVITNLTLFVFLPGIGLGIAAATLVGRAHGANDTAEAKQWGWDAARLGALFFACMGAPLLFFPHTILMVFIQDTETLALAEMPLRLAGLFLFTEAFGLVLTQSLYAVGKGRSAMRIAVPLQWLLFLPLVYVLGVVAGLGLTTVWCLQIGYRFVQAMLITRLWHCYAS